MRRSATTIGVSALGLALAVSLGASLVFAQYSNSNSNSNSNSTTNTNTSTTGRKFVRGDADYNGVVNLDDLKVYNNLQQYRPVARPANLAAFVCKDAADANDDGKITVDDAVKLIDFLFGSKAALKAPFPAASVDPTADTLGC